MEFLSTIPPSGQLLSSVGSKPRKVYLAQVSFTRADSSK